MAFLWSFHSMRETGEETALVAVEQTDIWAFQEVSMDQSAQCDNMRNGTEEGRKLWYTPLAICHTCVMMGPAVSARARNILSDATENALAIVFDDAAQRILVVVNVHLPTSWAPITALKDSLHDTSEMMRRLIAPSDKKIGTLIRTGDFNAEFMTEVTEHDGEDRKYILDEWMHEWNISAVEEKYEKNKGCC